MSFLRSHDFQTSAVGVGLAAICLALSNMAYRSARCVSEDTHETRESLRKSEVLTGYSSAAAGVVFSAILIENAVRIAKNAKE